MNRYLMLLMAALVLGCSRTTNPESSAGHPVPSAGRSAAAVGGGAGSAGTPPVAASGADAGAPPRAGQAGVEGVAGADAGSAQPGCNSMPEDLGVRAGDAAGYAPYAQQGCQLLYLASDGSLRLRDLRAGAETEIAPASDRPSRPCLAGPADEPARVLVWESGAQRAVQLLAAGKLRSLRGDYEHSAQPRATHGAVVFSAFRAAAASSDSDIMLYEIASDQLSVMGGGAGQQLFADISDAQVAYSDFSEDPDGRFDDNGNDLADVVVVDRKTLVPERLSLAGKQAFPLLGRGAGLVYLNWAASHPEPKLSAYQIVAWDGVDARMLAEVQTQPPFIRPSAFGDTVEWLERPYNSSPRLWRVRRSGGEPAKVAWSMAQLDPLANISTESATLMAVQGFNEPAARLISVPR